LSETDIEEYISENADKTLRQLQAEIRKNFNESRSLRWISKVRGKHAVGNPETTEDEIENAPEIVALKKKLRQTQLKKEILMAKEEIEEIGELLERIHELESDNNLLSKRLAMAMKGAREAWGEVRKLRNTPCPTCARKYIIKAIGGCIRNLCGSYVKEIRPLRS
jgi:hypothetical protein